MAHKQIYNLRKIPLESFNIFFNKRTAHLYFNKREFGNAFNGVEMSYGNV